MSILQISRRILLSSLAVASSLVVNPTVTMGDTIVTVPTMPSVTKPHLSEHHANRLVSVDTKESQRIPLIRSRGSGDQRLLTSSDAVPISRSSREQRLGHERMTLAFRRARSFTTMDMDSRVSPPPTQWTASISIPIAPGAVRSSYADHDCEPFGVRNAGKGLAPIYASSLRDIRKDEDYRIVLSAAGHLFVAGSTVSPHAPITSQRLQATDARHSDVFILKKIRGPVPFAACAAKAELKLYQPTDAKKSNDAFKVKGTFMLGKGGNGIAPLSEVVMLQVGTFVTMIPAGSFTLREGEFTFRGVIKGVTLAAMIRPVFHGNNYEFTVEGRGAELTGTVNPVTIGLSIGDDGGSTMVKADIK